MPYQILLLATALTAPPIGTELRTRRTTITASRHSPPTASFGRPPEYDEQLDLSREQFDFLSLKSFWQDQAD